MGRQVNFLALPEDIFEMGESIGQLGPIVILHSRSKTKEPRAVSTLNFEEDGKRWLFYCIVRQSDLPDVKTVYVPEQNYWSIDILDSPVVEFNSCYFDGKILRRGRVYYVDGRYDENGQWEYKSEDFRSWASTLLKVSRKCLKRYEGIYVGRGALEWMSAANGEIVFEGGVECITAAQMGR